MSPAPPLGAENTATYVKWFACMADPTRVRLLHAVATARGEVTVGALAEILEVSQSSAAGE